MALCLDSLDFEDGISVQSGDEEESDDDVIICGVVSGKQSPDLEANNNSKVKREDPSPKQNGPAPLLNGPSLTLNESLAPGVIADKDEANSEMPSSMEVSAHFALRATPEPTSSDARSGSVPAVKSEPMVRRVVEADAIEELSVKREPKLEPKWEAGSRRDENAVDEFGRVLKHVPFAKHPIIGGRNASSEPAIVDALLETAPPLLRTLSLLILHVKEQFLGLMWEGSTRAETVLKNMSDLQERIKGIFNERILDHEILQVENQKSDQVMSKKNGLVASTRHGMKTTLKIESTQVCTVRHGEKERAREKGTQDVFVRFVQLCLRATYVQLVSEPTRMLKVAYNSHALPDSFRFDKLIASDELESMSAWDMIQSYMTTRLPKIRIPVEEAGEEYMEPRFGCYSGRRPNVKREPGSNIKSEPGTDLFSRLDRLSTCSRGEFGNQRQRAKKEPQFSWDRRKEERSGSGGGSVKSEAPPRSKENESRRERHGGGPSIKSEARSQSHRRDSERSHGSSHHRDHREKDQRESRYEDDGRRSLRRERYSSRHSSESRDDRRDRRDGESHRSKGKGKGYR